MRKVYHFKMLRTAALILLGAPAFVAAGLLLIRLHPDTLLVCFTHIFIEKCSVTGNMPCIVSVP